jgi:uncharacterized damage-inducible protein DinB
MHPLIQEADNSLKALLTEMKKTLAGLPAEALDWSPGWEMNSMGVLAAHTAGSLKYWAGDVIAGTPSGRVRSLEFETRGKTAEELIAVLEAAFEYTGAVMSAISLEDLGQARLSPLHNREYTVAYCLLHIIEHAATHLGHMHVTRDMWLAR